MSCCWNEDNKTVGGEAKRKKEVLKAQVRPTHDCFTLCEQILCQ